MFDKDWVHLHRYKNLIVQSIGVMSNNLPSLNIKTKTFILLFRATEEYMKGELDFVEKVKKNVGDVEKIM